MNHENPIMSVEEFDRCLQQCFRAKNSLSNVQRYSPEQCVLGKAPKLPASATRDETSPSHLLAEDLNPQGGQFRNALLRRQAAREAFVKTENSQAIRRAVLRKSQGTIMNWQTGQLCTYWSKRDAPNMTEQGRWIGPAQLVMQESRSIVWVSYLNRLLRCARENLRPVSLREYQDLRLQDVPMDNPALEQRARELAQQLRDRNGTFQSRDLSLLDGPTPEVAAPEATADQPGTHPLLSRQPEEEPAGRNSDATVSPMPHEVPVPNTPFESEIGDSDNISNSKGLEGENPGLFSRNTSSGRNIGRRCRGYLQCLLNGASNR